jgi:phosphoenolpyruvate carboxykinase (ATP)
METADLNRLGVTWPGAVHRNLSPAALVERAIRNGEGQLAANGALTVSTGVFTGRSPKDKYIVRRPSSEDRVWWGPNAPMPPETAERLQSLMAKSLNGQDLFIFDGSAGADPNYALPVRVITPLAWQALFSHNLFLRETLPNSDDRRWTVLVAPDFSAPAEDLGLRSSTAVALDLERRLILICGTEYAGEIKKSIFTVVNYVMPERGAFPMHCSANVGADGGVALFFGLSGTGKTSLSTDPARGLIGDDEHVWTDAGTFNIEGGCYAKTICLSEPEEPEIFHAIRFGTVLENVILIPETREPDYTDASRTENTRVAYPLYDVENAVPSGMGGAPSVIFFLTADAFGVLPPLSLLTPEQARSYYLNGYTAKLAGAERGVTIPEPDFSACFAQPFLPLPPREYTRLFGEKLEAAGVPVYLLNTGWTGGPYGVGRRIPIAFTRAMVDAALSGELTNAETVTDPIFHLRRPVHVTGVPPEVLDPRATWSDKAAYDVEARKLADHFEENRRAWSE